MKIGVFGGSFNPIHNGHIALARQLRQLANLDEIWLMVSPQNPLKQGNNDLLDEQLRYQLVRLALHGEDGLRASNYELRLPKPSYTWHTLLHLKDDFPDDTFTLLIGGDNWNLFPHWYHSADILREHQVVVYPRRGSDINHSTLPHHVSVVNAELLDISSTEIRQRVRMGKDIGIYVPKPIVSLVRRLYE